MFSEDSFIFESSIAGLTTEDLANNSPIRRQRFIMKIRSDYTFLSCLIIF